MSTTNDVPSNIDFATEVKSDRLALLFKITIGIAVVMILLSLSATAYADIDLMVWVGAPLVLIAGSFLTQWMLREEYFESASWCFTLTTMAAVSTAMLANTEIGIQVLPFFYVVIVFVAGLLVRPRSTFIVAALSAALSLVIPRLLTGGWEFTDSGHHVVAVLLMFLSAALAAQVTGELYAVTEWALMNYQRERRMNFDLFESRSQLEKSLLRSEALSMRLRETNDELAEAHAAAEAAKNFRGQFLANMSHELRTPLNAIIGFSETMLKFPMMYDDTPLPETYEKDMSQIYSSGRQLLSLINDILDLARVDAGKLETYMQKVDPASIVKDAGAIAGGLIGAKPVELKMDIPDPMPLVWADETRLKQVLLNLYSNACKFTDSGEIKLTVAQVDDGLRFSLKDTGIGITAQQLEIIFEEFQQGNQAGRDARMGSGLGLAISRQLLRLMGGTIWAESEPGKGSTFHFQLQLYTENDEVPVIETPMIRVQAQVNGTVNATETKAVE
jgi:signal transduction histidine kinase